MLGHKLMLCYTTVASLRDAKQLAEKAIQDNVAGCVNIIPGMMSVYAQDGQINNSTECSLLFKLAPEQQAGLSVWLSHHHPYDTPAELFWLADSSDAFFAYIQQPIRH